MKKKPSLHVTQTNDGFTVILQGIWVKEAVKTLDLTFKTLTCKPEAHYTFDLSGISEFDTHGIMLILHYAKKFEAQKCVISNVGASESL